MWRCVSAGGWRSARTACSASPRRGSTATSATPRSPTARCRRRASRPARHGRSPSATSRTRPPRWWPRRANRRATRCSPNSAHGRARRISRRCATVSDEVLSGAPSDPAIAGRISSVPLTGRLPKWFWLGFAICYVFALLFLFSVTWLIINGIGTVGLNIPAAWGFIITSTVWWIGIGHAGTLISAVLILLNQDWRASINRFAEAMTLLAAAMAGMYPIIHLGRPQYFYWMLQLPVTHMPW